METTTWKYYKIRDLFDISVSKDKNLLSSDFGLTPYVSSSANNNGVSYCVDSVPSIEANTITVARNGSVGATFYQPNMYCASPDDVRILSPKFKITPAIGLFLCTIIEQEKYRYAYGRKFGTKRMSDTRIKLPSKDDTPDWEYIEEYVTKTLIPQLPSKARQVWEGVYDTKPISPTFINLDSVKWDWFDLISDRLFRFNRGTRLTKADSTIGNTPLVTAGKENQGIKRYVDNTMDTYSNCITIDMFGYCVYREYKFCCDDNILVLQPNENLSKYTLLFIATIINQDSYKCTYGRQYRQKTLQKHKIKLPIDSDGNPDWEFMENYIKSLPYSANI